MFHFKLQKEQKVRLLTEKPPLSSSSASDIFVARGGGGPERTIRQQQQQQQNNTSSHTPRYHYQQQQHQQHQYDSCHDDHNNNNEEGASLFFPLWRKRSHEQRLEQSRARAQELSVLYEVNSPLSDGRGGVGGVDSRPLIKASSFDSACSGSSAGLPKLSTIYMTPQQAMEAYARREAEALQNQLMDPLLTERERKQLLEKQQVVLKQAGPPALTTTTSAISSSSSSQPATTRRTMYQAAQQQHQPPAPIKADMVGIEIVPTRSFSSSFVATTPTPASSSGRSSYEFIENVPHLC